MSKAKVILIKSCDECPHMYKRKGIKGIFTNCRLKNGNSANFDKCPLPEIDE